LEDLLVAYGFEHAINVQQVSGNCSFSIMLIKMFHKAARWCYVCAYDQTVKAIE